MANVEIPIDMYESREELLIVVPLGGVSKETIRVRFVQGSLIIAGERAAPLLRDGFVPLEQQCYWGVFEKKIPLPSAVYYDKIHPECYDDNILLVVIPKVIVPEDVAYTVSYIPTDHANTQHTTSERKTFGGDSKKTTTYDEEGGVSLEDLDSENDTEQPRDANKNKKEKKSNG